MSDIGKRTIDYLNEYGWYQGGALGPNNEHCIVSALAEVGSRHDVAPYSVIMSNLQALCDIAGYYSVPQWNDAPQTSFEDIVLVLKWLDEELAG